MFKELKEMLLNQVDCIVELLETYGFEDIRWTHRELRFKRDAEGGMNRSIKLDNNDALLVHDFARGVSTDIFAYIVKEKDVKLGEVLSRVKSLLKLENNWVPQKKIELFGGIYNRIVNKTSANELLKEYPREILDNYDLACNERFRRDGISYKTQRYFGLMFDVVSNRIVIPLYDELGRLVGVKGRINRSDVEDNVPKYLYLYLNLLNLGKRNTGSTLPSMTFDTYYSLEIKLPNLDEQCKIANYIFDIVNKIIPNSLTTTKVVNINLIIRYWIALLQHYY
mgnify:CR=1 FL=1